MLPAIKSEYKKLFTVRSTYFLLGGVVAMVIFYSFYIIGWKASAEDLRNADALTSNISGALTSLPPILGAIVAILLMTHEYRYNTILHTLTASNSRTKVLIAKFLVVSVFALIFTAVVAVLTTTFMYLGIKAHGNMLVAQHIYYHEYVWHALFYGWGYITSALLLAALIRNQIGAIVALFAIPTLEQLLILLLKKNSVYLPYVSLNQVIGQGADSRIGTIAPGKAALVFGTYLVVGWIVAWYLFVKRDAN
ncbi:MAG TPA: ABC transporter permease [Candidatus Saccharimonadales bacterium]|nr:ABC transporter permease [Candidatus Saccharimonadales bacterium]